MISVLIYLILLAILIIASAYCYLTWHFDYWHKQDVKGPRPQLFKGTFPKSFAGKCSLIEELHEIYIKYKTSERCVGIFSGYTPKLFILDPTLAAEILTNNFTKFRVNESSKWTSSRVERLRVCSPFVSSGKEWRARRSDLAPILSINHLRSYYESMLESADQLVSFIERQSYTYLNAKELANRYTIHVMSKFIWGIEDNIFENIHQKTPLHRMADNMLEQALKCVSSYEKTISWRILRPIRFFPKETDVFFLNVIKILMNQREESPEKRTNDVISHLVAIKEKKSLNDEQIAGNTTTVLIDGFETVAVVVAHCLLLLARNERVQTKLRATLNENESLLSYDELMNLRYLDQCIQETLRLFPPLTTLFKLCVESITIKVNESGKHVNLKAGDSVYISSYSFHHDANYFAYPEDFWPERFNEELGGIKKFREMGVFLPFGDGPRMCPGLKLGLSEIKVAIFKLVKNFIITPTKNTRIDNRLEINSFLLSVKDSIELNFLKIPKDTQTIP
uniref:Cytochrome P450 n=1 Tax=Glossina austeni TaxID=7395 RepID=A0A1A9UXZ0_GLOAU